MSLSKSWYEEVEEYEADHDVGEEQIDRSAEENEIYRIPKMVGNSHAGGTDNAREVNTVGKTVVKGRHRKVERGKKTDGIYDMAGNKCVNGMDSIKDVTANQSVERRKECRGATETKDNKSNLRNQINTTFKDKTVIKKMRAEKNTADSTGNTKAELSKTAEKNLDVKEVVDKTAAEGGKVIPCYKESVNTRHVNDGMKDNTKDSSEASKDSNKLSKTDIPEDSDLGKGEQKDKEVEVWTSIEDKEVSDTVQSQIDTRLHSMNKSDYRTALQVDTSYTTGISSDSNCSQYSISSWASEQDTSSSLDPSPNMWNSFVDSGVSFGTSTGLYSDTSDVSGEDCSAYDGSKHLPPVQFHSEYEGKGFQIHSRYPHPNKLCYTSAYNAYNNSVTNNNSVLNGAIQNENGAFQSMTVYGGDSTGISILNYETNPGEYCGHMTSDRDFTCEYCGYCTCSDYEQFSHENLFPGDVFYYSANSIVVCVKQTRQGYEKDYTLQQVTPKLQGLNPNATVFSLQKSSTPTAPGHLSDRQPADNEQGDGHNDSGIGIGNSAESVSDYSFANGDMSLDKSGNTVFSPDVAESPFQAEFSPFTDNQAFTDNASLAMKLDELGPALVEGPGEGPLVEGVGDSSSVPMQGVQYTAENGSITDGEAHDGGIPEDQVRMVLKNQLESLFSRENLSNDSYLQSQMDADQYVPIATVASLDQVQKLSNDLQLIVEILRGSTFVQVDDKGEKVRPNHNRCIVILREIPESTPIEDVQNLFSGENCPRFVSCEFAHNSNWYVTFDSDADAQRAYQFLREEVQTFLGKPIMARIKAKPLIRTYRPQNGYINKRFQPQPVVSPLPTEQQVTSSATSPQFTTTPPFTLMPNVSQYLNGQQAMPFYPPPPNILQNWPSPTMLDPSMVLAMNGYQATGVKMNNQVPNRNLYHSNTVSNNNTSSSSSNNNRGSNRNQKSSSGNQSMGRERINSNDSLPPRLQHQHERQQNAANNNSAHSHGPPQGHIHSGMPHNQHNQHNQPGGGHGNHGNHPNHGNHLPPPHPHHHKNLHSISNHGPPSFGGRRGEGGHPHHGGPSHSHGNHSNSHMHNAAGPHSGGMMSHHQHHQQSSPHHQQQQQQHLDSNNNTSSSVAGGPRNGRLQSDLRNNDGYAGKSYRRRKREDDGARPNRSNSSQTSTKEGGPPAFSSRSLPPNKFDYEPTSFPPLPGAESNTASEEVFESKLSDVVKGTAKTQVKEMPKSSSPVLPSGPNTALTSSTNTKPVNASKESSFTQSVASLQSAPSQSAISVASSAAVTMSSRVTATTDPSVAQPASVSQTRSSKSIPPVQSVAECKTSQERPLSHSNSIDKDMSSNSVKLSYAQMVQKAKAAEVSANSLADDDSEAEDTVESSSLPASSRALKEQGQTPVQANTLVKNSQSSGKEFARKDSNGCDPDSRRDHDLKKENYHQDDPKEQRANRRLKENRERRYENRDSGRRFDRRDAPPPRERDGLKTAIAK
ncbi:uncharacterized protein LOC128241884 isoform X1 [Mya arenaria]|uniref:uncharacterized protein LOC128241884 isoform X1 n=1 Tax=Mya arenaria TaxID=6604 RepID=UPI0022E7A2A3|nr:uncharacterized protein LOC128241884 isoform X1 [Mya arenaria]